MTRFYAWANIFLSTLSTACFFQVIFLNVPHRWPRRSDGPGANVNLRNLWLNSVLNAVFTRIDRLPPYVFNITAELKMAARRRGEDIIDFSMGNPDGATPPHIVEKNCVPLPSVRIPTVTLLLAVFLVCAARFHVGIRNVMTSISTRNQKPS